MNRGFGDDLDPIIHPLQRLRICALLEPVTEEEFVTIRDLIGVTDSALSKQIGALVDAGYVEQRRATRAGRRRLWLRLTAVGRVALLRHVAALRAIVER